jgi:hypothetical protein
MGREEMQTGFGGEELEESERSRVLKVRLFFKWILKKYYEAEWMGLIWQAIGTSGRRL